jgi:hypothetical protein
MPSTDIDGSTIIILSQIEAVRIYHRLKTSDTPLDEVELGIVRKIERDLEL